ncbi:RDD family protein [Mycoplasmatota bacterium]|nr:RDD family protein [Mycoplasmatota bacterium]
MKGKRIGAAIIDGIIISSGISIIYTLVSLLTYSTHVYSAINIRLIIILSNAILPLLIYFIYYTCLPYLTKGSTIGKLIVGIKVVSLDYKAPSFKHLFLRNIFFFEILLFNVPITFITLTMLGGSLSVVLTLLTGLICLGINVAMFIMIISTEDERGLHDYIAKTCVVSRQFDIDKINQANALERSQMDWAIFEDSNPIQSDENINYNNNGDQIEILNNKD